MTNITYLTNITPDLREAMPVTELVHRLTKASEDWKHPILALYADMFHDALIDYGYNNYQMATMENFATDIYEMVLDLWSFNYHADTIAYKLTRAIYGG
ncbi:hypothetical protein PAF15_06630 [Weissella koreensis]|uniref:hypothetical protein n=1 Tax=Weissella koreensis TaxID=165096 RepID=UPI0022BA4CF4|nr:hypothetical protein [Weissella koreensis]MCZ9311614.1 hypothetical protein [Weissella koreensis]